MIVLWTWNYLASINYQTQTWLERSGDLLCVIGWHSTTLWQLLYGLHLHHSWLQPLRLCSTGYSFMARRFRMRFPLLENVQFQLLSLSSEPTSILSHQKHKQATLDLIPLTWPPAIRQHLLYRFPHYVPSNASLRGKLNLINPPLWQGVIIEKGKPRQLLSLSSPEWFLLLPYWYHSLHILQNMVFLPCLKSKHPSFVQKLPWFWIPLLTVRFSS